MIKLTFIVVTSIVAVIGCNAQETSTNIETAKAADINSSNEKAPNAKIDQISEYIREVFQDSDGVMWFGTNGDGLARYDGESLSFLSVKDGLAGGAIRGILQSPDGALWFATNDGVSRYQSGKFTNYTTANGLTENQVWSIFQDSDGMIWVGTMGGVCRFDGTTFVPFPIPRAKVENPVEGFGPQVVWSMFQDRDGNIWFGTDGEGVRKYDGESFTSYTNEQGLAGNTVRSIVGDKQGRIWFGTRLGGVSCLEDGKFKNFANADGLTNDEVYEILEDSRGSLWFSTRGEGVCRYDGKEFTSFGVADGLTLPHVQCIFEDKAGVIWLGCSGGLFSYDGKSFVNVGKDGPWTARTATPENADDFQTTIRPLLVKYCADCHAPGEMEDLDFLTATTATDVAKHRGLFAGVADQIESQKMPPKDCDQFTDAERKLVVEWLKTSLDLKPSETDRIAPYVVDVYEDKKGDLWFGTMNNGVARYDRKQLVYFSEEDGLPCNTASSFAEDKDGNLWVGTQSGVCKFDGEKFNRVGTAEGLPTPKGRSPMSWAGVSADNNGNIWVSVARKLYRFDGQSFSEFKTPIVSDQIKSFAILAGDVSLALEDSAGNQWFSTDGDGAYKFDGENFTHYTKSDGLCSNNVNSIVEDKEGNIWFACMQSYQPEMTGDGGVCRLVGSTFTRFPGIEGLGNNDIYTIYKTRAGDIWIGASGVGAYRFDGEEFTLFSETDKPHWTRNFGIQDMLESRNGTLWFGFSGGLFRFNGKSFYNVTQDGPWVRLSVAMAEVAAGDAGDENKRDWYHSQTRVAMSELAKGEFDEAKTILQKLKAEEPNEPTIQENLLNEVGYELIFAKQLDRAIEVLRINTILYPNAFNTFDSLAEAYHRKGDEKLAVEYYRKSVELNPENVSASDAIKTIFARQKYEDVLVAPEDWLEEVIVCPPSFAPTMSISGMEHLRLPPQFRDPDSDWFLSYLFAIELSESTPVIEKGEQAIGEQLLIYFQGLASGRADKDGKPIDIDKFTIEPRKLETNETEEYSFVLTWQEPFARGTHLKQHISAKLISGKNQHGILFICGSPKPLDSDSPVWTELLSIRSRFESALTK